MADSRESAERAPENRLETPRRLRNRVLFPICLVVAAAIGRNSHDTARALCSKVPNSPELDEFAHFAEGLSRLGDSSLTQVSRKISFFPARLFSAQVNRIYRPIGGADFGPRGPLAQADDPPLAVAMSRWATTIDLHCFLPHQEGISRVLQTRQRLYKPILISICSLDRRIRGCPRGTGGPLGGHRTMRSLVRARPPRAGQLRLARGDG